MQQHVRACMQCMRAPFVIADVHADAVGELLGQLQETLFVCAVAAAEHH
jgi:hypothetical protein